MKQNNSTRDLPWKELTVIDPDTIDALAAHAGLTIEKRQQPTVAAMLSYLTADVEALDNHLDQRQRAQGESWLPIW